MALSIEFMAKEFVNRLQDGKDLVVAGTGFEGDGKSTIEIQLAIAMHNITKVPFSLEKNILYSPTFDEMKTKVTSLPPLSFIGGDEAIKALYKLRWREKLQSYINTLYAICRKERKLTFLCMPRFSDFNEYFRQHRIRFWIHIIEGISVSRNIGYAAVFSRSWNPFAQDSWNFKEMDKLINEYARLKKLKETEFSLQHKAAILSKSRNFVGLLEFHKLPDDIFAQYEEYKSKYAYQDMDVVEKDKKSRREITWMTRTQRIIQYQLDEGKTLKEVGNMLGVSPSRISQIMEEKTS